MRLLMIIACIILALVAVAQQVQPIPALPAGAKVNHASGMATNNGFGKTDIKPAVDYNFKLTSSQGVRHKDDPQVQAIKKLKSDMRDGTVPYDPSVELTNGFDGQMLSANKTATLQVSANFAGFNDPSAYPNDNDVAVSNSGTVVAVCNSNISMYQTNGTQLYSQSFTAFFGNDPNLAGLIFDPKIVYDDVNDRFFMVALVGNTANTSKVIVAASTTSDPATGSWNYYWFNTSGFDPGVWFDYPTIGINDTKLFVSGNMYLDNGNRQGTTIMVFNKADILAGGQLTFNYWQDVVDNLGVSGFTIHPVTYAASGNYGPNALFVSTQPGGATAFQVWVYDNANNTINGFSVNSPQYALGSNAVQPGLGATLDVGDCRVKGATYIYDPVAQVGTIHFVFISVFNGSGVRNGVVKADIKLNGSNLVPGGNAFGYTNGDMAHPNLAFLGEDGSNNDVVVVANYSSSSESPGSVAFSVDANYQSSTYLTLKSGLGNITADQGQGETKIRWGDYMGAFRKKNTGGNGNGDPVVWLSSSYGLSNNQGGTWLTEVTANSATLSADGPQAPEPVIEAYPNPAQDKTTLVFELTAPAITNIAIHSTSGATASQVFYNDRLTAGEHRIEITTADLPNGLHILEVTAENGQHFQKKVVVQR